MVLFYTRALQITDISERAQLRALRGAADMMPDPRSDPPSFRVW
jgi:hypothetical protein